MFSTYSALIFSLLAITVSGFLTWIAVRLPLAGTVAEPGAPWPLPVSWAPGPQQKSLDPESFQFTTNLENCDVIQGAFERYRKLIHLSEVGQRDESLPHLQGLEVHIMTTACGESHYPAYGDDESYSLTISSTNSGMLHAETIWGALRGLETFSQLIYLTDDNKYRINETTIEDSPRFAYRGLMIDTARHYYPLSTIFKILDAMSWDKFNVFHWHIVDDQSFPYVSTTFPNMSELGAYSPHHVYTQENVSAVIREARLRGIRVIPEFDTPGHTWSWGKSFPWLITPCWGKGVEGGPHVPNYEEHGPDEIINPMLNSTYTILKSLYEEISQKFPDEYLHLGMDEVYHACWKSNPNLTEWMGEMGFSTTAEVEQYYAQQLIKIVQGLQRRTKYVIWQDPIEHDVTVDSDTVIQIWKDVSLGDQFKPWQEYASLVADRGKYEMILSGPWYLSHISYGQDWRKYYLEDPANFTDDASLQSLMKGGEACSWSEYIDSGNILSLLWPRASAVAERLWSSRESTNDIESAKYRLDQQRCRYVRRGVPAKPILNGYCGDYEWEYYEKTDGEGGNSGAPTIYLNFYCLNAVLFTTILSVLYRLQMSSMKF